MNGKVCMINESSHTCTQVFFCFDVATETIFFLVYPIIEKVSMCRE